MAWELKGQLIESCSCNMFCPCWFGVQDLMIMDQGWCSGALALRIEEGSADGVDLGGRKLLLAGHFPGPTMYDGNGTGRLYIDDGASDEQRAALEEIGQGKKGGPMEQLGALIGTWLPTETAAIEVSENGDGIEIKVGDAGKLRSNLLRDPEGNTFTLEGGGFVAGLGYERVELASTNGGAWTEATGLPVSFETKSGARGAVTWAG